MPTCCKKIDQHQWKSNGILESTEDQSKVNRKKTHQDVVRERLVTRPGAVGERALKQVRQLEQVEVVAVDDLDLDAYEARAAAPVAVRQIAEAYSVRLRALRRCRECKRPGNALQVRMMFRRLVI